MNGGGIAINDSSQGLKVQVWIAFYEGGVIKVKPLDSNVSTSVLAVAGVTELAFAFDQNMRATLAYVVNNISYLYFYDTLISNTTIVTLDVGVISPRLSMDDSRDNQTSNNDIILAYLKDNKLYMRVQRDRYLLEYLLTEDIVPGSVLKQTGMTIVNRFQFEVF